MTPNEQAPASPPPGGRSSFAHADVADRRRKAAKVRRILEAHAPFATAEILDIGTGAGIMAAEWARGCKRLHSVDVADQRVESAGYTFTLIADETLPFPDASFDMVISNQVIEHVWHPPRHIAEMARVLRFGGVAYLSTPNRFTLLEPHHRLPLLAWFGDAFAHRYLRLVRGKTWDVKLFSLRALCRLLRPHFEVHDAVPAVMADPLGFHQAASAQQARWLRRLPAFFWRARFNPLLPSFMLVLRRRSQK